MFTKDNKPFHYIMQWSLSIVDTIGTQLAWGGGDGHSRMIVFLKYLPNNFPTTVLQELEKGVQLNGLSER